MHADRTLPRDRWPLFICLPIVLASGFLLFSSSTTTPSSRNNIFVVPTPAPLSEAEIAQQAHNPSERALAEYSLVTRLLEAGKPKDALQVLNQASKRPIVISPTGGGGPAPENVAPSAQVISLSRTLCDQAKAFASQGDKETSQAFVQAGYAMAEQALATPEPTLDALMAARSIDLRMVRGEKEIYRLERDTTKIALAEQQEDGMEAFYRTTVLPSLEYARSRRDAAAQGRPFVSQFYPASPSPEVSFADPPVKMSMKDAEAKDRQLADRLIHLYQTERKRLQNGGKLKASSKRTPNSDARTVSASSGHAQNA